MSSSTEQPSPFDTSSLALACNVSATLLSAADSSSILPITSGVCSAVDVASFSASSSPATFSLDSSSALVLSPALSTPTRASSFQVSSVLTTASGVVTTPVDAVSSFALPSLSITSEVVISGTPTISEIASSAAITPPPFGAISVVGTQLIKSAPDLALSSPTSSKILSSSQTALEAISNIGTTFIGSSAGLVLTNLASNSATASVATELSSASSPQLTQSHAAPPPIIENSMTDAISATPPPVKLPSSSADVLDSDVSATSSKPPATSTTASPTTAISKAGTSSVSQTPVVPQSSHGSTSITAQSNIISSSARVTANGSSATSTTVSVQVIKASTTSTSTSTVTTLPESTFSSIVGGVTVTNLADGSVSLSVPPLVTILSTSREPDGSFTTLTHVIANPTGFSNVHAEDRSGFIHNQGAVAGVFTVIGIIATAVAVGLYWLIRRRRRLDRRRRWLAGMQQQRPMSLTGDPFQDPQGPPMMSAAGNQGDGVPWDGSNGVLYTDEQRGPSRNSLGFAGVGSGSYTMRRPAPDAGNSNDSREPRWGNAGLTPAVAGFMNLARHSPAPSTPSVYPASLPPAGDEFSVPYENQHKPAVQVEKPVVEPPPRPPRSHLRETALRAMQYQPLTPPASSSSHSGPSSPISSASEFKGQQEMFARRTLLDIHPRLSPDSSTGGLSS